MFNMDFENKKRRADMINWLISKSESWYTDRSSFQTLSDLDLLCRHLDYQKNVYSFVLHFNRVINQSFFSRSLTFCLLLLLWCLIPTGGQIKGLRSYAVTRCCLLSSRALSLSSGGSVCFAAQFKCKGTFSSLLFTFYPNLSVVRTWSEVISKFLSQLLSENFKCV